MNNPGDTVVENKGGCCGLCGGEGVSKLCDEWLCQDCFDELTVDETVCRILSSLEDLQGMINQRKLNGKPPIKINHELRQMTITLSSLIQLCEADAETPVIVESVAGVLDRQMKGYKRAIAGVEKWIIIEADEDAKKCGEDFVCLDVWGKKETLEIIEKIYQGNSEGSPVYVKSWRENSLGRPVPEIFFKPVINEKGR